MFFSFPWLLRGWLNRTHIFNKKKKHTQIYRHCIRIYEHIQGIEYENGEKNRTHITQIFVVRSRLCFVEKKNRTIFFFFKEAKSMNGVQMK